MKQYNNQAEFIGISFAGSNNNSLPILKIGAYSTSLQITSNTLITAVSIQANSVLQNTSMNIATKQYASIPVNTSMINPNMFFFLFIGSILISNPDLNAFYTHLSTRFSFLCVINGLSYLKVYFSFFLVSLVQNILFVIPNLIVVSFMKTVIPSPSASFVILIFLIQALDHTLTTGAIIPLLRFFSLFQIVFQHILLYW